MMHLYGLNYKEGTIDVEYETKVKFAKGLGMICNEITGDHSNVNQISIRFVCKCVQFYNHFKLDCCVQTEQSYWVPMYYLGMHYLVAT